MTEENTGEVNEARIVGKLKKENLTGSIVRLLLDELKESKDPMPWDTRPQEKQQRLIDRCASLAQDIVTATVRTVASDGRQELHATVDKFVLKPDRVDGTISIDFEDARHFQLQDLAGKKVQIIVADTSQYQPAEGHGVKASPDQGDILDGVDESNEAEADKPAAPNQDEPKASETEAAEPAQDNALITRFHKYAMDRIGHDDNELLCGWWLDNKVDHLEAMDENDNATRLKVVDGGAGFVVTKGRAITKGLRDHAGWKAIGMLVEEFNAILADEEAEKNSVDSVEDADFAEVDEEQTEGGESAGPVPDGKEAEEMAAQEDEGDTDGITASQPMSSEETGGEPDPEVPKTVDEIRSDGMKAFTAGDQRTSNPYPHGNEAHVAWDMGWVQGLVDQQNAQTDSYKTQPATPNEHSTEETNYYGDSKPQSELYRPEAKAAEGGVPDIPDFLKRGGKTDEPHDPENDGEELTSDTLEKINQQGFDAFQQGLGTDANHYVPDTDAYRAWDAGWARGLKAKTANRQNGGSPDLPPAA